MSYFVRMLPLLLPCLCVVCVCLAAHEARLRGALQAPEAEPDHAVDGAFPAAVQQGATLVHLLLRRPLHGETLTSSRTPSRATLPMRASRTYPMGLMPKICEERNSNCQQVHNYYGRKVILLK